MRKLLVAAGFGLVLMVFLPSIAESQVFGPRPVYVQPVFRVWKLPSSAASQEVLKALDVIAKDFRVSVTPIGDVEQAFRVKTSRLAGKQLDQYCEYPIRNLEDWDPMSTFGLDYMRAHRERWQQNWEGRGCPHSVSL